MLKQDRRKIIQFIQTLMRDRQYSQRDLAKVAGVPKSTVSDILANKGTDKVIERFASLMVALRYDPAAGFIAARCGRNDLAVVPQFSAAAPFLYWQFYKDQNIEPESDAGLAACEALCSGLTSLYRNKPDTRDWRKADTSQIVSQMKASAHATRFASDGTIKM